MNRGAAQYPKLLNQYLQVKKLQIFAVLKRLNFSGQLTWTNPQGQQWILFFNLGQVIYGTGGVHPTRQWYRQVQAYLPDLDLSYEALQQSVASCPSHGWPNCWDYQLLHHWLTQGQLSPQVFHNISAKIMADILFDVVQADNIKYQLIRQTPRNHSQVPIYLNEAELLPWVTELWEAWLEADLESYSPNLAPIVQHPEPIQAEVSPRVYQTLMQLLDGQRSLRDLAVKLGQDVLNLTQVLRPYLRAGWISLIELEDFPGD
ncbi:MAG: hypothetical protein HC922_09925 [Leptolyngbyaceae cyanobacterium SM2_3_12]|nr:hypothetical protein [Leptolyngbyaceae cyanobacterium SM2_3_12]